MYKNWKAICKIPDTRVMWALALLDTDSELGQKFVERFPEYFAMEQTKPYPFSLMREVALKRDLELYKDCLCGGRLLVRHKAVPEHIPVRKFDKRYRENRANPDAPPLPSGIKLNIHEGKIITWEGKLFVVLENNFSSEKLYIAPVELVDVDIDT